MPNAQLNAEKKETETWRVPETLLVDVDLTEGSE